MMWKKCQTAVRKHSVKRFHNKGSWRGGDLLQVRAELVCVSFNSRHAKGHFQTTLTRQAWGSHKTAQKQGRFFFQGAVRSSLNRSSHGRQETLSADRFIF